MASGASELWAGGARPGHRLDGLGEAALEVERPLHLAASGSDRTLCGQLVWDLREYPVDFARQERRLRCPLCDQEFSRRGT
jgi:hypothetical protein